VFVSALTGQGLDVLREVLSQAAISRLNPDSLHFFGPGETLAMHNHALEGSPVGGDPQTSPSVEHEYAQR
jgi:hypothetical protein